MPPVILTSNQVRAACHAAQVPDDVLNIPDTEYVCPTEDSLRAFGKRFHVWLNHTGLARFADERNDCDEYALHAMSKAKEDHARFYVAEHALAFGLAWIATDTQLHAVNVVIHLDENKQPNLNLCEPQITYNDRGTIGVPFIAMRTFPLSSVRRWLLVCF